MLDAAVESERHVALVGRSMGLPDERIMLAEDGTVVDLVAGLAAISGKIGVWCVCVDGLEVGDTTLKDRLILGEDGFLTIVVAVDLKAGRVTYGPEITARGFGDDPDALKPVTAELTDVIEKALADGVSAAAAAHRRALDRPAVPPPADAHPDGRRGLSGLTGVSVMRGSLIAWRTGSTPSASPPWPRRPAARPT